ncbi:MAG: hypothetical protein WCS73_00840 [Lentisphaeria bacterium]
MSFVITFENAMMIYTIFIILLTALCYIFDKIQDHSRAWNLSKSELMKCQKCGKVYLLKRQEKSRRCPYCGQRAVSFRLPYSGIREKAKVKVREL